MTAPAGGGFVLGSDLPEGFGAGDALLPAVGELGASAQQRKPIW